MSFFMLFYFYFCFLHVFLVSSVGLPGWPYSCISASEVVGGRVVELLSHTSHTSHTPPQPQGRGHCGGGWWRLAGGWRGRALPTLPI